MKRIFLIGYMGCGKTTTGKRIAKKYGLQFVDLDQYIEKRFFKSITQIFAEKGEDEFRKTERKMLEEVASFENVVISTGGGAACFFDNIDFMNKCGETVYLKGSAEALFEYLRNASQDRPLLKGKSPEEMLQFIKENLGKREPFYAKAKHTIDSRDMSDTLFDQICK